MGEIHSIAKEIAKYWVQLNSVRNPRDYVDYWIVCGEIGGRDMYLYERIVSIGDESTPHIQELVATYVDRFNVLLKGLQQ